MKVICDAVAGPIADAAGETWAAVGSALFNGDRGLPGGSSLTQLLAEHRGVRNIHSLPPFRMEQIIVWAKAHHQQTGHWPTRRSGPIGDSGETWLAVENALRNGSRGLPGGSSLTEVVRGLKAAGS